MLPARPHPQARRLVPEVVQTSVMDCGPASLQALVQGFGLSVNYGRLREACQTGVDGTSITMIDEIGNYLGLDTEEMMLPADHLLLREAHALPAILVVRNPDGTNHFVVVWSAVGPWLQVMDPGEGRHWVLRSVMLDKALVHTASVPSQAWRDWVAEAEFQDALRVRLGELEIGRDDRERLIAQALADPTWEAMAALDAAVRMTAAMVRSGAVPRGAACLPLIAGAVEPAPPGETPRYPLILGEYRSAWRRPDTAPDDDTIDVRGVVIVRARGLRGAAPARIAAVDDAGAPAAPPGLPPELAARLNEREVRPGRTLWNMLVADGIATPLVLAMVLAVSAALVTVDAILLRGFLEIGSELGLPSQRAAAVLGLIGVLAIGLAIELPLMAGALRLGRALDLKLRLAFLTKIPRLDDRYFRSRLLSDMAERGHSLHVVRALPVIGMRLLASSTQLILTVAGIAWLQPASAPLALITAVACIALPLVIQPVLAERELRVRAHAGALGRFYLDALLGLLPIRVHGARPAMQRQQETLLVQWVRAGLRFQAASTIVEGTLALSGLVMAVMMVRSVSSHNASGLLLLVYWALGLPALGQDIAMVARQYPTLRNVVARLLEPLSTPEPEAVAEDAPGAAAPTGAAHVVMSGVTVEAGGNVVLEAVDLDLAPGEHVAVVGASGAGKSSLVGLLLGWYRPSIGTVSVDGRQLVGDWLNTLRRDTAWVDPAVTLWNRSFLENLRYGAVDDAELPLAEILSRARLREVLEHLPDGLATELGEGGGMVSGGEGQRTRVGRALARKHARLVILDEPFRGLDLKTRRELMAMAREWWRDATLLWVTHDIAETESFGRVLVLDAGKIVEDGDPAELARRPGSRYLALASGDRLMHQLEWAGDRWRKIWMVDGRVHEEPAREETAA